MAVTKVVLDVGDLDNNETLKSNRNRYIRYIYHNNIPSNLLLDYLTFILKKKLILKTIKQ